MRKHHLRKKTCITSNWTNTLLRVVISVCRWKANLSALFIIFLLYVKMKWNHRSIGQFQRHPFTYIIYICMVCKPFLIKNKGEIAHTVWAFTKNVVLIQITPVTRDLGRIEWRKRTTRSETWCLDSIYCPPFLHVTIGFNRITLWYTFPHSWLITGFVA